MIPALAAPSTTPEPPARLLPHRVWYYSAVSRSVSAARHDVATQLGRWELDGLIDTAAVVTSELVTNALDASQRAQHPSEDDGLTSRIAMCLTYSHRDVIVEVWDSGEGLPTLHTADPDAEDGRGLHLVSALTRDTGHYRARVRTADGYLTRGKIVWAALSHDAPPVCLVSERPATNLPRRNPSSVRAKTTGAPDVFDPALLQRVLDGLRNPDGWTHHATPTHPDSHAPPT